MLRSNDTLNGQVLICLLAAAALIAGCGAKETMRLSGAGATFPNPVYQKWIYQYHQYAGTEITYQSIGSGGGIRQIKAKTVDFGASDAPLKPEELDEAGLIQFPMVMGGVVPVVNLAGVQPGSLKLTAQALADIFLGKITRWDDPAVTAANPSLDLPGSEITVVHRADGSGTTWIFTNYLAKVSKAWEEQVGWGKAVDWPAGIGGKGNEGVAAYVQRTQGSIGYVEYAYALQNELPHVLLRNRAGTYAAPTMESFQAAAANADWAHAPGFYLVLTDQPGEGSWPITGASFILLHREQQDPVKANQMLAFFEWCYGYGSQEAEKLHYVPMPQEVVERVKALWKQTVSKPD